MKIRKRIKSITTGLLLGLLVLDSIILVYYITFDTSPNIASVVILLMALPLTILSFMSFLYQRNIKLLIQKIDEREQSIDDMLKLVEAKCDEARVIAKNKTDFLSNMSHEIRTPINAILGMNEMILRDCEDAAIYSYAYNVKNSGNMLLSLINDILDFSKIESGKMELSYGSYGMSSLINDLVTMANSRIKDKKIELKLEISSELPCELYGDDVRLKQIIVNLLTNAIKYTDEGEIRFRIYGEQKDNFYLFRYEVEDTGIGIKEEDLAKISEKFTRFNQSRNKYVEGTGLGLNITNRLLQLMGSKLQVRSVYGKGSVFYFDLEQKIIDFKTIGNFEYKFDDIKTTEKYSVSFTAPEVTVLVVDDNEMNRNVFKALLKDTEIKIDEADSGMKCLEVIHEKKYDVIFMDHMMPGMDGIETFHKLKSSKLHYNTDTPVIILTANAISGAKEKYLSEGFDDFLSKPIVPERLENIIVEYIPKDKVKPGAPKKKKEVKIQVEQMPSVEGLDWNYAAIHFQDADTLDIGIQSFYRSIHAEANKLEGFYEEIAKTEKNDDVVNEFRIQVHAMKSAANTIGITPLSGMAASLEYAARDNKLDMIKSVTPFFLDNWKSYTDKLKVCIKEEEKTEIEDIGEIKESLEALTAAVAEFDIDLADEIMKYLRGIVFPDSLQEIFSLLEASVVDLDEDTVRETVSRIINTLEV